MPAAAVDRPERCDVGRDDDVPGHAGEQTALGVDDRPAWPNEVDRAVGLPVGDCRIRTPVQDLDRPRSQREDADADTDERCEAADTQDETWAAEKRRGCARVRLQPAAAGKRARKLRPAPAGIGGRDRYGVYGGADGGGPPVVGAV